MKELFKKFIAAVWHWDVEESEKYARIIQEKFIENIQPKTKNEKKLLELLDEITGQIIDLENRAMPGEELDDTLHELTHDEYFLKSVCQVARFLRINISQTINSFINPGGYKMKHRKRNRHGRFVSNPGFLVSPVTYAVGIPIFGVLGYFAFKTKLFGILKKKSTSPTTTPVLPSPGTPLIVRGRIHYPSAPTYQPV